MKKLFKCKQIIFSKKFKPAELVSTFTVGKAKYARVAFTNEVRIKGMVKVVDIPYADVVGIRSLPSPFKKFCFKLIGLRAKGIYSQIAPNP